MSSLNMVQLIGNLGGDPETKDLNNGGELCKFSLATTEKWKREGEKQERTDWHKVVVFGKLAEICSEYLEKGHKVYIQGQLRTRTWDDDDGKTRYMTEVVLSGPGAKMVMLGTPKDKPRQEERQERALSEPDDDLPF